MDALVTVSILIATAITVGGLLVFLVGPSTTTDILLGGVVLIAVAIVLSVMGVYDFVLWLRETARLEPIED